MPNTCSICKHKDREQIETALARGQSLRNIAVQFGLKAHSNVARHQTCIAAQLQTLKASHSARLNETLIERLNRYRLVAERFLNDDDKALSALDRCFKQADIEAKLTGEYQKKQENKPDAEKHREITIEAYTLLFDEKSREDALAEVYAIIDAPDHDSRRDAIRAVMEADAAAVDAVWHIAEANVSERLM